MYGVVLTSLESSKMYSGLARLVCRCALGFHCAAAAAALRLGTDRRTRDGRGSSKSSANASKSPYLNETHEYYDVKREKNFKLNIRQTHLVLNESEHVF